MSDMKERVAVYEGNVEAYKKKLEELSDLKRQVKVLEEKNSDYMQHNMELEEEVKKSGTWRPQLDMYKKQVAELHQKLAEESKSADRRNFDNKKLNVKIEALMQEKEVRNFLYKLYEKLNLIVADYFQPLVVFAYLNKTPVGMEHPIALPTPRCFQILLMPRMFPIWDFVVGIFARKALLNMDWVLSTPNC